MDSKIILGLLMVSVVLAVPQAEAQSESNSVISQKRIDVTIDGEGDVVVVHQIRDSNEMRQLKLVDGTISNLEFIDASGKQEPVEIAEGDNYVSILPDQGEMFVRYNLDDALALKNNIWTMNFRYVHTTVFTIPEEAESLFINQKPISLDGDNSFRCHGCQMVLEYLIDEPKSYERVNWEDQEFVVGMNTFADIEGFEFDQPSRQISFKVNDGNQFVTTVIPQELLWGPYVVFLDDQKIFFDQFISNGTHVWVTMKPNIEGKITIIGTTVVPEFPVIAPLAVGFLIILLAPLVRRFILNGENIMMASTSQEMPGRSIGH